MFGFRWTLLIVSLFHAPTSSLGKGPGWSPTSHPSWSCFLWRVQRACVGHLVSHSLSKQPLRNVKIGRLAAFATCHEPWIGFCFPTVCPFHAGVWLGMTVTGSFSGTFRGLSIHPLLTGMVLETLLRLQEPLPRMF